MDQLVIDVGTFQTGQDYTGKVQAYPGQMAVSVVWTDFEGAAHFFTVFAHEARNLSALLAKAAMEAE